MFVSREHVVSCNVAYCISKSSLYPRGHDTEIYCGQEQPKKVAVIGAGYIAVELAGVFQSLGTDTTLVVRYDRPLRSFDSLVVETLMSEMDKAGLALKTHSTTKVREENAYA